MNDPDDGDGFLRAHYKLDEPSGTSVLDSSPFQQHGVAVNGPAPSTSDVPGTLQYADPSGLYFDGAYRYVAIPNMDMNVFTVSAWVKREEGGSGTPVIVCGGYNSWGIGFMGGLMGAGDGTLFLSQIGVGNVVSTSQVGTDGWHLVTVTYDGTYANFYIDGAIKDPADANVYYGVSFSSPGNYQFAGNLQGTLDDVRIYAGVLTPAQVSYIYAGNPDTLPANPYVTTEDAQLNVDAAHGVLLNDAPPPVAVVPCTTTSTLGAAVSLASAGSYTYNPTTSVILNALPAGKIVLDTFHYTVEGPGGVQDTAMVSVQVNGINDVPVTQTDSYTMLHDRTLDTAAAGLPSVLANDSDADTGDTLQVISVAGVALTGGSATTTLANGAQITMYSTGAFIFTPAPGFTTPPGSPVTIAYQVSDGSATVSSTIQIDVATLFGEAGNNFTAIEGGLSSNASTSNLAPINAYVHAFEGVPASNALVTTFNYANPLTVAADFSAVIDWGDSTATSAGTVSGSLGDFQVAGTHTYAATGTYTVNTTILGPGSTATTGVTKAVIVQALFTAQNTTLQATEFAAFSNTLVATFTDPNLSTTSGSYTAQIYWGDGSAPATGTITGSGGNFSVHGGYTYDWAGSFPVTVEITKTGGDTVRVESTATVSSVPDTLDLSGAAVSGQGGTFRAVQGSAFTSVTLASFSDGNFIAQASDYTVQVNWGDGSALDATAVVDGFNGAYIVSGGHTYATVGVFAVTVSIQRTGGSTSAAAVAIVSTMSPAGLSFTAAEGVAASNVALADLTDSNTTTVDTDYQITINWGDGTPLDLTGTVSGGAGDFAIAGTHTYIQGGSYDVTVTITDASGYTSVVQSTATVTDSLITATGGASLSGPAGSFTSVVLATFSDPDPNATAASYQATIDWGDNSETTGVVQATATGYEVVGNHIYTGLGNYTVTVTIRSLGGSSAAVTTSAAISAPLFAATGTIIPATEGYALASVILCSFYGPSTVSSDYTAVVDWGDDGPLDTSVAINGNFTVTGSHTYSAAGYYTITARITESNGTTHAVPCAAEVAGASFSGTSVSVALTEGANTSVTVATFTGGNPLLLAADYKALIDWGDGNLTDGTVTLTGSVFSVWGSNPYLLAGSYAVKSTITDLDDQRGLTVTSTAVVANAPLSVTAATLQATQCVFLCTTVATFTDDNAYSAVGIYSATVDWGDGATSAATRVQGENGTYSVQASHSYSAPGSYSVTITVQDDEGGTAVANGTAYVAAMPTYTLATFAGPDPDPTVYTASINWGDSTSPSVGIIQGSQGAYSVVGQHAYAQPGVYQTTVSLNVPAGIIVDILAQAAVAQAPGIGGQAPAPAAPLPNRHAGPPQPISRMQMPAVTDRRGLWNYWSAARAVLNTTNNKSRHFVRDAIAMLDDGSFSLSRIPWIDPSIFVAGAPRVYAALPIPPFVTVGPDLSVTHGTNSFSKTAQQARLNIRVNLLSIKQTLVDQIYMMLIAQAPPVDVPPNSFTAISTIASTLGLNAAGDFSASANLLARRGFRPQDYVQAANEAADMLIRLTDRFLEEHDGARPRIEGRVELRWALADGYFRRNSPWCADWAGAMHAWGKAYRNQNSSSMMNQLLNFWWYQCVLAPDCQHNFIMVAPRSYMIQLSVPGNAAVDPVAFVFDPWRELVPRLYNPRDLTAASPFDTANYFAPTQRANTTPGNIINPYE